MENYVLFVIVAAATITSPGPGVILTITNSLRYGFWGAIPGVFGIASGVLFVSIISATSLAAILETSAFAFIIVKFIGAGYLIYLGLKLWSSSASIKVSYDTKKSKKHKFVEGLLITLLNPKPIFFFMALFPQFINSTENYLIQFAFLSITFSFLVVIIHCTYALFAKKAKSKLSTPKGTQFLSKAGGSIYIFFGIQLATTNR